MDFRGVTRLFSDPDWDGPVEQDEHFHHDSTKKHPPMAPYVPNNPIDSPENLSVPIVDKYGCRVKIINKTVSVYDANGKLIVGNTLSPSISIARSSRPMISLA